jgi:hypothetical protein
MALPIANTALYVVGARIHAIAGPRRASEGPQVDQEPEKRGARLSRRVQLALCVGVNNNEI